MLIDILIIIFNYLNIKLKVMELFSYSDLLIPGVVASQFLILIFNSLRSNISSFDGAPLRYSLML